jgi:hypothetical protein
MAALDLTEVRASEAHIIARLRVRRSVGPAKEIYPEA